MKSFAQLLDEIEKKYRKMMNSGKKTIRFAFNKNKVSIHWYLNGSEVWINDMMKIPASDLKNPRWRFQLGKMGIVSDDISKYGEIHKW